MTDWQLVNTTIDGGPGDYLGFSSSLSQDGSILALGCKGTNVVKIYKNLLGSWSLMGSTISGLGYIVSLSADGNTIAIGCPTTMAESVSIFVYDVQGNVWVLSTTIPGAQYSQFGASLALSNLGTTLVVGSPSYSGSNINIYINVGNVWSLAQTINDTGTFFGFSVAISDDGFGHDGYVIAVGAWGNAGSVNIYTYNGNQWFNTTTLNGNYDSFGYSVALVQNGSMIAIGTMMSNYVKVYQNSSGNWQQKGSTIMGQSNSNFGSSVSLCNNILAVGANQYIGANQYNMNGALFMYEFSNAYWYQMGSPILGTNDSNFGCSNALSADGRTVAVGAYSGGTGYPIQSGFAQVYNFPAQTHNWYWLDISGTFIDINNQNQITDLSFNGYFSVNNDINVVDALYNIAYTQVPNQNILLMTYLGFPFPQQDNLYQSGWQSFDASGLYIDMTVDPSFLGIANIPGFVDLVYSNYGNYTYYSSFNLAGDTLNNSVLTTTQIRLISGMQSQFSLALNYNIRPMVPNQDPSCFIEGTTILCLDANFAEVYVPIKDIRSGMLVKTHLHGFRCVDLIGKRDMANTHHWNLAVHRLPKSYANGLTDDLFVTGGHSILVDSISDADLATYREKKVFIDGEPIKIDDKYLLLAGISDQFVKIENEESYVYYHLCLVSDGDDDRRFGIWANGCLTETVSRNQFLMHDYEIL